jgi:hypothetical protein
LSSYAIAKTYHCSTAQNFTAYTVCGALLLCAPCAGFTSSKNAGHISAVHQPLEVERAISIAHKCSSIDNPAFAPDPDHELISASSSQQQEAPSCPPQLDKGLRCRVSTASSLAPGAGAARLGSSGGLTGHQLSAGSVGATHRATPLSSKDALGELRGIQ